MFKPTFSTYVLRAVGFLGGLTIVVALGWAPWKQIPTRDGMMDVLYAYNQASEYLTEAQKQLGQVMETHPEAQSVMREYEAVQRSMWGDQGWMECPRQSNLHVVDLVQRSYDALRLCGIDVPPTIVYNIEAYNRWVDRYESLTDRYNLAGWDRTPMLFRISLVLWADPLAAAG